MDVPYPPEADPEVIAEAVHPPTTGPRRLLRFLPLVLIVAVVAIVFGTGANRYLSLDMLQEKRMELLAFVGEHPVWGVVAYILCYVVLVAFSIPGALIMSMSGGFLFGAALGSTAAVTGMTIGATIMYLAARSALGEFFKSRTRIGALVQRVEKGVRGNAFVYLLVLRLLPAVPFWMCNIVSGFVSIPLRTYVAATILGVIPSTVVYASIGSGLGAIFDRGEKPSLRLVLDPDILYPLLGMVALSTAPAFYHAWRVRREKGRKVSAASL